MADPNTLINSATRTLEVEIAALTALGQRIDHQFTAACEMMLSCTGKVVVCGVGKSGHIATKIAATLASTGTPAFSLHPTEAAHGDLGMVESNDVMIAISYSGSSDELIAILPTLHIKRVSVIALTGKPESPLAQAAQVHINTSVSEEACPHNLAPTASTTVSLVIGDMLAVALLQARGFTKEDFALSHPAGRLGKRLILRVGDMMHPAPKIPLVTADQQLEECLLTMTSHKLGMLGIIDEQGFIIGIFTDGDLRRILEQGLDWRKTQINELMTKNFVTVPTSLLAIDALTLFEQKKINGTFVINDNGTPVGAFNMHDLLHSGIV